jgi:hypothetical protein
MQREQEKRSRARAKQEKRLAKRDEDEPEEGAVTTDEDQASILDALAQLHEDLAEGRVSLEIFEAKQEELRNSIRID